MKRETIVAVYDIAANADAAVSDLKACGVPESAISRHSRESVDAAGEPEARRHGLWSKLFGGEPGPAETAVYDRAVAAGWIVVTVGAPADQAENVMSILNRHYPVDFDDRAARSDLGSDAEMAGPDVAPAPAGVQTADVGLPPRAPDAGVPETGATAAAAGDVPARERRAEEPLREDEEERIPLVEEQLSVGKRLVNRGTNRIRRFVVETPVDEKVTFHSEKASIERRPVAGDTPVADPDFTEKIVEVTELEEEPVVQKTARVKEEVVIHKDVADRVETVRDTARREDIEIINDAVPRTAPEREDVVPPPRKRAAR